MADKLYTKKPSLLADLFDFLLVRHFRRVNQSKEWHLLPKWRGILNLVALRAELREHNLYDTDGDLTKPKTGCRFDPDPPARMMRTASGTQNDLQYPAMGCRGSRLGRNVPRNITAPDLAKLMTPNPLLVSQKLLARDVFKPAASLNLLAAAWIQFQVHDWFSHEKEDLNSGKDLHVPQDGGWADPSGMKLVKTKPDPERLSELDDKYPAYRNADPQWWDASQVYGETEKETRSLRIDRSDSMIDWSDPAIDWFDAKYPLCPLGHLYLDENGFLPKNTNTGSTVSGFTDNWWLGLEILHTLFAKEHNAICDHIKKSQKGLSDEEIFEKARLVNCAIMAKIHTVEWTPAILDHPTIQPALDINWKGFLGQWFGEGLARKIAGFLPTKFPMKDMLTGIPLSDTEQFGAPYALTEEFTAVYRLHPLIPDQVEVKDYQTGAVRKCFQTIDIAFTKARAPFTSAGASMDDAIYSFGTAHPGAITIKNFPKFLRELKISPDPPERTVEQILDLAAVDILRDRERGVPRYNEFRRQLRKEPVKDWNELAGGDGELAKELETVYDGKLEDVDTMVGMFCEPLPKGFGFSDTAFRIFILMASRRLKSDRFFTTDYRKEIYTESGLEWVRRTGMKEVILRHHPKLEFAFEGVRNPFAPWRIII
jgi:heme peroxidase